MKTYAHLQPPHESDKFTKNQLGKGKYDRVGSPVSHESGGTMSNWNMGSPNLSRPFDGTIKNQSSAKDLNKLSLPNQTPNMRNQGTGISPLGLEINGT
jgi:hypothetical protein